MLRGLMNLDASNVQNHRVCRLGYWYFGDGKKMFGHLDSFQELDKVHAKFHMLCAEAINLYKASNAAKALQMTGEIEKLSNTVIAILNDIKKAKMS